MLIKSNAGMTELLKLPVRDSSKKKKSINMLMNLVGYVDNMSKWWVLAETWIL